MALYQPGCCNNATLRNTDNSFYLLQTVEKLRKTWLGAINRKDKLPKKIFISSDYFEEVFDASCKHQNEMFYKHQPTKPHKEISPSILFHKENIKQSQIYLLLCLAYILNQLLVILLNFVKY